MTFMQRWLRPFSTLLKPRSLHRTFPSSGFKTLPASEKLEEETLEWYSPSTFYPVRIGQVFQSRYQTVSKLGYGSSATVWLCRDFVDQKYVALKVCIRDYPSIPRETVAFQRLQNLGKPSTFVQNCWDSFKIEGVKEGIEHQCFVLEPLSFNLASCNIFFPDGKWDLPMFRRVALEMLQGLRFLHTEAKLIHCDLRRENFLMRPPNHDVFRQTEERELQSPSPMKMDGERVVYATWLVAPKDFSNAVLCDFGEARPGDTQEEYFDDIQPFPYRAPEVIFDIPFSYPVDIWNAGVLLWHIFEGKSLFHPYTKKSNQESDLAHLREMVAVMGTPPPSLLRRSRREDLRTLIFDESGRWLTEIPIPDMSLELAEARLEKEDKAEFLRFIRRFLQWEPEARATASELCDDPWLKSS